MQRFFVKLLAGCAFALAGALAVSAEQPGVTGQSPPGVYRFVIGDVRVTALSDGTVPINLHDLLRGITPEQIDKLLADYYLANPLEASINAFLIETGSRRVLVDAGSGELFGPGYGGRIPEALRAAGTKPEEINDVLITHVHTDHSGGLVAGGKRVFPNAIIHVGKPDVDFFLDVSNAAKTGYNVRYFNEATKELKPYLDAGKLESFTGRAEVAPGVVGEVHPGHTPGSAFYTLTSHGESLVFIGDIIHAAAVQFPSPDVTITFDQDQDKAREVRRSAFAQFAAQGSLIAAPHLPFPGVGHLRSDGPGYRWLPVEYGDRTTADTKSRSQLEKFLRSAP